MIAIVCPSNRPESLERWRREWRAEFDRPDVRVYEILDEPETWLQIKRDLGEDSWIIPRKTDCIRSYGFWRAWQDGAEQVITLDDDCYPEQMLIAEHQFLLIRGFDRWGSTITGLRPRGLPYQDPGGRPCAINMGLWSCCPDLDAQTQLDQGPLGAFEDDWAGHDQMYPASQFFPMSGMNLAFRREILPAMYFGLQGTHLWSDDAFGYDRFGDIWAGLFAKKICDHLGYAVRSGSPWVRHERASDPHVNLVKERLAKEANEWLWQRVDDVKLTKGGVVACYHELADKLQLPDELYWRFLRRAMHVWADLFA